MHSYQVIRVVTSVHLFGEMHRWHDRTVNSNNSISMMQASLSNTAYTARDREANEEEKYKGMVLITVDNS